MSDKKNFYYRQQVLEANLDEAFDAAEDAVRDLTYDTDLIARTPTSSKAEFGGIMWGFYDEAHIAGGMLLRVSEGVAYDESGRRIHVDATYEIDITNDGSTAIGTGGATSGGNAIDPGTNKERWVTIFAVFDRLVSDPRYDGYNDLVYFENAESFHFEVVAGSTIADLGTIDPDPAVGGASARIADKVLILDCLVTNTAGSLAIDSVNTTASTRRDEWFWNVVVSGTADTSIQFKGNIRDVVKALMVYYNDHINGSVDFHPAGDLAFSGATQVWADGSGHAYTAAISVFGALEGIVDDLNTKNVVNPGAAMIGVGVTSGSSLQTPLYSSPTELANATLQATLETIKDALNGRVFRGGDEGIAGTLAPDTTGRDLGKTTARWDAYLDQLSANTIISAVSMEQELTVETATGKVVLDSASLGLESSALILSKDITRIKPTAASKGLELDGQDLPDVGGVSAIANQSANSLAKITDPLGGIPLVIEAGGRLARPHHIYDDFNYPNNTITQDSLPLHYNSSYANPGDILVDDSVIEIRSGNTGSAWQELYTGTFRLDTSRSLWRCFTRALVGTQGATTRVDFIGLVETGGAGWKIGFIHDYATFSDHNWHAYIYDGSTSATADLGVLVTDTFHNLGFWMISSTVILFAADDGTPVSVTSPTPMTSGAQIFLRAAVSASELYNHKLWMDYWELFDHQAIYGNQGADPRSAAFSP
jgi:hypothetical protein